MKLRTGIKSFARTKIMKVALAGTAFAIGIALGGVSDSPACECSTCPDKYDFDDRRQFSQTNPSGFFSGSRIKQEATETCDIDEFRSILKRIQQLQSKAVLLTQLTENYRVTNTGVVRTWTEDIPEQFHREQFQATFSQVLDELMANAELVGFDCFEPPCIAKLRVGANARVSVVKSKTWLENFRTGPRESFLYIDCGDGREEVVQLVEPLWDPDHDLKKMTKEELSKWGKAKYKRLTEENRSEEEKSFDLRRSRRREKIKENWKCAPAQ